ncbi:MAG: hypothetical protein WCZ23_00190 [Rhodospirillaceae bacterium]
MNEQAASGSLREKTVVTGGHRREFLSFILLAFVALPMVMFGAIAAYGFIVWFLQILFFGPPT